MPITADGYSMEMDLVTRRRRESGKVPIIFATVDASCQASSGKSAESAACPPVSAVPEANETRRDVVECAAISQIFRPLPSVRLARNNNRSVVHLFVSLGRNVALSLIVR